jgi:hypothetical protein
MNIGLRGRGGRGVDDVDLEANTVGGEGAQTPVLIAVPGVGRSGGRGAGVEGLRTAVPSTGPLYRYALFEALSVADMVGPSRRAPVHAEAMHFYCEHGWLP